MAALTFEIDHRDSTSAARLGRVTTPHGTFETPAFMPVGTQATIKGILPEILRQLGARIILANTYHLLLRPGAELIAQMGGLQRWMNWHGPILTDSGGYQVFSLAHISRLDDDGVTFQSHIDGSRVELTPERAVGVQHQLGADIIMALDDCPPGWHEQAQPNLPHATPRLSRPQYLARLNQANERTLRWLERCMRTHRSAGREEEQALFGIVQGGIDLDQRTYCARGVTQHDLPGYAIGGVSVGEGPEHMKRVVEHTAPLLPADRPRYLMGVGYERDLVMAIRAGVDMFDCVLPTRNGRNANAFTSTGQIRLRNARYRDDPRPIEPGCDCPACSAEAAPSAGASPASPKPRSTDAPTPTHYYSRSYLRHLFQANEMLGPMLVSAHNIRHFQRLILDIRTSIRKNNWSWAVRRWPVLGEAVPISV